VQRVGTLPVSWTLTDGRSVSGFDLMTAAQQKAEGWYPVTEQRATLGSNQVWGDPTYTVRTNDVLAVYPAVADSTENITRADLTAKARTALTANVSFLGTVGTRRTAIASGKSTATTGKTATVTTVAQAQTQIRSAWTILEQVATALDDLNNQAEAVTKQNDAIIKLLLGASDLLQDETGT
jgi:hypothetical protein